MEMGKKTDKSSHFDVFLGFGFRLFREKGESLLLKQTRPLLRVSHSTQVVFVSCFFRVEALSQSVSPFCAVACISANILAVRMRRPKNRRPACWLLPGGLFGIPRLFAEAASRRLLTDCPPVAGCSYTLVIRGLSLER